MLVRIMMVMMFAGVSAQTELLATFGGYTYFKARIDPAKWPPTQLITDAVVYATCFGATGGGSPPPCPGLDSCKYAADASNPLCVPASERGCDQPMLNLAAAMGCASVLDPMCETRLSGVWGSMGGKWRGGSACGRTLVEAAFCADGSAYLVNGSEWPLCRVAGASKYSCVAPNNITLTHYALCVAPVPTMCTQGKPDFSKLDGGCALGSCAKGWYGSLCNLPCTSETCNGRNDATKLDGGVTTNNVSQCVCTCLPQFGPGGTDPRRCSECVLPGSNLCAPYTATSLATSSNVPLRVLRNTYFAIILIAVFPLTTQVDTSVSSVRIIAQDTLSTTAVELYGDPGLMENGRVAFVLRFLRPCHNVTMQCVLTFSAATGTLKSLTIPPIEVMTQCMRVALESPDPFPLTLQVNSTFVVRLTAVDEAGIRDKYCTASVEMSCTAGDAFRVSSVVKIDHYYTFEMVFSRPFRGQLSFFSTNFTNRLLLPVFDVTTTASRMRLVFPEMFPSSVARGARFEATIQAIDLAGNVDSRHNASMYVTATNLNVTMEGVAWLINGQGTIFMSFNRVCTMCTVTLRSGNLEDLTLPIMSATTIASTVAPVPLVGPTQLLVGERKVLPPFFAVDAVGDIDERTLVLVTNIKLVLRAGGGNGDGGDMSWDSLFSTISFSRACTACYVTVNYFATGASVPTVPTLTGIIGPFVVSGVPVRLSSSVNAIPLLLLPQMALLSVNLFAIDRDNNIVETLSKRGYTATLRLGGGNGDGGVLLTSVTSSLGNMTLQFTKPCGACVVDIASPDSVIPLRTTLPPIRVLCLRSVGLRIMTLVPVTLRVADYVRVVVASVDEDGLIDMSDQGTLRMVAPYAEVILIRNGTAELRVQFNATSELKFYHVEKMLVGWQPVASAQVVVMSRGTHLVATKLPSTSPLTLEVEIRSVDEQGATDTDPSYRLLVTARSDLNNVTLTGQYLINGRTTFVIPVSAITRVVRFSASGVSSVVVVDYIPATGDDVFLLGAIPPTIMRDTAFTMYVATGMQLPPPSVSLLAGGGNGNGGALQVNTTVMISGGMVMYDVAFSRACTACLLRIDRLVLPPIKVLTSTRNLTVTQSHQGRALTLTVRAVDENGDTNEADNGTIVFGISRSLKDPIGFTKMTSGMAEYTTEFIACCSLFVGMANTSAILPLEIAVTKTFVFGQTRAPSPLTPESQSATSWSTQEIATWVGVGMGGILVITMAVLAIYMVCFRRAANPMPEPIAAVPEDDEEMTSPANPIVNCFPSYIPSNNDGSNLSRPKTPDWVPRELGENRASSIFREREKRRVNFLENGSV